MSAMAEQGPGGPAGLVLTPAQQKKRQRARNLAIALCVAFMCVLFYAITIVKLGPGILNRAL